MSEKDLFVGALNDVYGEFLGGKQKRLISAYYDEDLSLAEISELEGITRQAVLDSIKRTSEKLYLFEEKCGYCKKFLAMKELSDKLEDKSETAVKLKEIIDNL